METRAQLSLFDDVQNLRSALAGGDVLLKWDQFRDLTLGQLHSAVAECSPEAHEGATNLFVPFGGMAGPETERAYLQLCRGVRSYAAGEGPAPDWAPFFAALKREFQSQLVTDETPLRTLAGLFWEAHTAPD
jgi:hypothetical protein